ncbi:hypothetical protein OG242_04530 [Streptomyces sp. NBC_00727]|uniref:hypothetical protein n=1 Tax=Streptomyces sp. NBC_00727 TaxID=2903675 RepID=UPI0038699EC7
MTEVRGACAHHQAADAPARIRKTGAADLAEALGTGLADLPGRHYACWETPVEYGVIRNGFEPA